MPSLAPGTLIPVAGLSPGPGRICSWVQLTLEGEKQSNRVGSQSELEGPQRKSKSELVEENGFKN